mmetsp:Transcript_20182/g.58566  ORF Transcript_20182/g.58566 Transcript_20182/m.58566 type:complete len:100 (+) Transcript_20182:49-348(+)
MRAFATGLVAAALLLDAAAPAGAARAGVRVLRQPEIAAKMAGLEGEACSADEHKRFTAVVCRIEAACGCAGTVCELDWCSEYVHGWRKEFGACTLRGCP